MRKFTTICCCLLFMASGVLLAISNKNKLDAAKTMSAATIPQPYVVDSAELPLDLRLGSKDTKIEVQDTLSEKVDSVTTKPAPKPVKKVKTYRHKKQAPVEPDTIASQPKLDTLYVSNPVVIIHRCPNCHNDSIQICIDEQ